MNLQRTLFIFLLCLTGLFLTVPALGGDNLWKAGCARTIITPKEPMWMAGFAARTAPSEGTLADLWAKALTLEDAEGNRAVLVTADILGFPKDLSDDIRDYVRRKYGFDRSRIILSASHTHSGPVLGDALYFIYPMKEADRKIVRRYTSQFKNQIVNLIDASMQQLEPVRIETGMGQVNFAVNRRNNKERALTPTTELKGPYDHAVPVLKIERPDGTLKTIIFGYSCHPTVLSGQLFSGDYAGFAQTEIEKLNPGVQAMFFQGTGADQNPLPRHKVSLAVQYGKQLAASVKQVLSEDMVPQESRLRTHYAEIELPLDEPISRKQLEKLATGNTYESRWAQGVLGRGEKVVPPLKAYPYPISVWTIGAQRLVALGGEVVSGYSIRLKQLYGNDLFVMGYANDVMNYIPTTVIWDEGGYEGMTASRVYALPARWTRDVEERIIGVVERLLENTE